MDSAMPANCEHQTNTVTPGDSMLSPSASVSSFESAVAKEANDKNKKLKWDKLPKYNQWKLFKAYMHENKITDGNLFKRMKSMISEKRTDAFVTYDITTQTITNVDFKHEVFIRERSKKKKAQVQRAQAEEEAKVKELEAAINGLVLSTTTSNIEVVFEDDIALTSDED